MVNRGDGGGKRPTPPSARPAPRAPARPAADDGEEKTSAINLSDVDLDELDAPSAPVKKPVPPPRPRPAQVDEDIEKTNAINLADVNLDDLDAVPSRGAPARPQPSARPAPARPAPPPPKAPPPRAADPEDDEKTSAINSKDVASQLEALKQRRAAAQAASAPVAAAPEPARQAPPPRQPPAQAPAPRAPQREEPPKPVTPPKKEEVIERTMAVSLEEIEGKLGKPPAPKGKTEPAAADRTYVVGDDEPEAAAPQPKRLPAALAAKMSADAAPVTAKTASAPAKAGAKEAVETEPKLVVRAGPDLGKSFTLSKDLTLVGRGLDADIVINDASASRKHFNIVRTLSGWKLVDLGSGNGTKLDGVKVSEVALKHGMRIDLGATTLEYVFEEAKAAPAPVESPKPGRGTVTDDAKPPERKRNAARLDSVDDDIAALKASAKAPAAPADEEKTSFGDIASLQIDPAWEARRAKQRRDVDEVKTSESTSEVEAAVVTKTGGAGKKIAIAGAVVALLGGGFVAADKFAGLGIIFPKAAPVQTSTETTPTDKDKSPKEDPNANAGASTKESGVSEADKKKKAKEAEAKDKEGDEAYKEGRYIAALAAYEAAIELDSLVDGAEGGIGLVNEELKAAQQLVKLIGLQAEGKHAEAAQVAMSIGKSLGMRAKAEKLLQEAREEVVPALFSRATELIEKKDYAPAKESFDLSVKIAGAELEPTDVKSIVAAFKDAIDRGLAKDADMSDADPSVKGEPIDLKAAFDAYAKGDVATAINELDRIQDPSKKASKADVGKSMAYSGAAMLVDERMKASSALKDKFEEMVPLLRVARLADALLGGLQRTKIEVTYAKGLVPGMKKALDGKDFYLSSLLANFILKHDAAQADAKTTLEATLKAGKDTFAEAKKVQKDDPDKALALALEALRLLPTSDADHAEAKKLVSDLTKSE
jgi:tetratricopeptide (TPR) repeat protein